MDSWAPEQLRRMELGGNKRFKDFLQEYNVSQTTPINQKYITRAALQYKLTLDSLMEGTEAPPPLDVNSGSQPDPSYAQPARATKPAEPTPCGSVGNSAPTANTGFSRGPDLMRDVKEFLPENAVNHLYDAVYGVKKFATNKLAEAEVDGFVSMATNTTRDAMETLKNASNKYL